MGTLERWAARTAEAQARNLEQRASLASTGRGRRRLQDRADAVRDQAGLDPPTVELPIQAAPGRAAQPGGGRRRMPLKQRIQATAVVAVLVAAGWAWLTSGDAPAPALAAADVAACADARGALTELSAAPGAGPVEGEAATLAAAERVQGASVDATDGTVSLNLRAAAADLRTGDGPAAAAARVDAGCGATG